ncbi:MAG TPA: NAD(P)/FAD-dependent oxidoreductase [Spirochaetia bacterium]
MRPWAVLKRKKSWRKTMNEKVAIIGAGAYGLALGSYLAMNGFKVDIFEMHNAPGGVCTAWARGGYTFDGCIHWLMGSGPSSSIYRLWEELHAVQGRRFVEWDEYITVRLKSGERFTVYTDPARLEAEMLRIAPRDGTHIRALCGAIRRLSRIDMPIAMETTSLSRKISMMSGLALFGPIMLRWGGVSVTAFCARLQSPVLAEALGTLYGGEGEMPDFPMTGLIMMLAYMHKKANGYPIGGSLAFARAIEKRFLELGGAVHYGTRIDRIVVKNDRAVGVAHGAEVHDADLVVSCADGHATIFDMLGGAYLSAEQREAYRSMPTFPSLLYVGLGIARNMSGEPTMKLFPLKEPMVLEEGALKVSTLSVRFFNFDPTTAPPGKTAAIVMISTRNHEYWTRLRREDPACYKKQKELVGERVVDALEAEVGGIREAVEVVDVSTPATWIRYTGNWKGSYEGFLPTRKTMMKNLGFTLPGLDRFYMNGQWVSVGGGLPPAAMNGRALAKRICKEFGRKFEALV